MVSVCCGSWGDGWEYDIREVTKRLELARKDNYNLHLKCSTLTRRVEELEKLLQESVKK